MYRAILLASRLDIDTYDTAIYVIESYEGLVKIALEELCNPITEAAFLTELETKGYK